MARCGRNYRTWSSFRVPQPVMTPRWLWGGCTPRFRITSLRRGCPIHRCIRSAAPTILFYGARSVAAENNWVGAAPTGRVAYIDIRDLSEAAAFVLRDPTLHGKTYDLSGPDAYPFPEIAQLLSRILGYEVTYLPASRDDRRSALLGQGISEWFTELLLSLETSAEAGELGTVTTTLKELLDHDRSTCLLRTPHLPGHSLGRDYLDSRIAHTSPVSVTMYAVWPMISSEVGWFRPVAIGVIVPSLLTRSSAPVSGSAGEPSG